ncbi:MAG TPA: hypothetical protein VHE99_07515 [Gammaproteobacteria bacterium]|nr:hypothetical protein [Gammaproteobacteria bacterium]
MYYTITRPGDSWLSLAKSHFGSKLNPSLLDAFIHLNQPAFTCEKLGTAIGNRPDIFCPLPANQAIWLPEEFCSMPRHYQGIKNILNASPIHAKPNLSRMEEAGIRPRYAVAATLVTKQIQHELNTKDQDNFLDSGLMATALSGPTFDHLQEETHAAVKELKQLNGAIKAYNLSPKYAEKIKPQLIKANNALNKAVAKVALNHTHFTLDRTIRRADVYAALGERGFSLFDDDDARQVLATANNLHWLGRGIMGFDIAFRVGKVFEVYQKDGNWKKEAVLQAGGFGSAAFGGWIGKVGIKSALKAFNIEETSAGLATGAEIAEGVTLAALGPEIVVILVITASGYSAEKGFEFIINKFGN